MTEITNNLAVWLTIVLFMPRVLTRLNTILKVVGSDLGDKKTCFRNVIYCPTIK